MTTACPCQVVLLFSSSPSWFPVFLARVLLSHIFTFLAFISFLLSVEPKLQAWSHGVALLIHCGGAGPARPCAVRSGCCERSESARPGRQAPASGLSAAVCHVLSSQALWEAGSASAVRPGVFAIFKVLRIVIIFLK